MARSGYIEATVVVPRTKVVRARLSDKEKEAFEEDARAAGKNASEFLRDLCLGYRSSRDVAGRLDRLEARVEHVENEVAKQWVQLGAQHDQHDQQGR